MRYLNSITKKNKNLLGEAISHHLLSEIEGLMVFIDDLIGLGGELPEIVRAEVDYELITKG